VIRSPEIIVTSLAFRFVGKAYEKSWNLWKVWYSVWSNPEEGYQENGNYSTCQIQLHILREGRVRLLSLFEYSCWICCSRVKRQATGIWKCLRCKKVMAGGAYVLRWIFVCRLITFNDLKFCLIEQHRCCNNCSNCHIKIKEGQNGGCCRLSSFIVSLSFPSIFNYILMVVR